MKLDIIEIANKMDKDDIKQMELHLNDNRKTLEEIGYNKQKIKREIDKARTKYMEAWWRTEVKDESDQMFIYNTQGAIIGVQDYAGARALIVKAMAIKKVNGVIVDTTNTPIGRPQLSDAIDSCFPEIAPQANRDLTEKIKVMKDQVIKPDKHHIVFLNGRVNIKTLDFEEGKDFISVNKIPWNWNPKAEGKLTQKIIARLHEKETNEGFEQQLYEQVGMNMAQNKDFGNKVAFFLNGRPSNGKSFWNEKFLQPAIGRNSWSTIDFGDFNANQIANFVNKTAVFEDDMSKGRASSKMISAFKKATGSDNLQAKILFQDQFTFTNYATINVNCNGLPNLADPGDGGAATTRIHNIEFTVNVKDKYNDAIEIMEQLSEDKQDEMEYLVCQGVRALHNVIYVNKKLTKTTLSISTYKKHINSSDTVSAFLSRWITMERLDPSNPTMSKLYVFYKASFDESWMDKDGVTYEGGVNEGQRQVGRNKFISIIEDKAEHFKYEVKFSGNVKKVYVEEHKETLERFNIEL